MERENWIPVFLRFHRIMARLRELWDRALVTVINSRSRSSGSASLEGEEVDALLSILKDREEEIAELKATDEKRRQVFRRNMKKWRAKQAESRQLRAKNRTLRRLLRKRRDRLREVLQRHRDQEEHIINGSQQQAFAIAGVAVPLSFDRSPPANLSEFLVRKWGDYSLLPWKHWMRLGSYFQYDPRPLERDTIPTVKRTPGGWPRFTVVTPSFQQGVYLEETLQSVIEQGYPNLDYIVMDGGSTDGSVDIIRDNEDDLSHWQSQPDEGQAAAIREGFERSDGEIMGWLNSDDVIFPGTLAYVADYFRQHPEVDVVYGHRIIRNAGGFETGRWILPPHDPEILPWADFIPQECTFWRRRLYDKVGGIDPSFQFALDWDLFLRFQRAGAKIVRLPYFMGGFRIHADQKNAVTLGTDGYREMKRIRDEALGPLFQRGGLHKRINWLQAKAVMTTCLLRCGVRL